MFQKRTEQNLSIRDIVLLTPAKLGEERGFFSEINNEATFNAVGIDAEFVQDSLSLSRQSGVVRGLHLQSAPHAQGRLIRVIRGRIFDVAIDIRFGSPTHGQHVAVELSAENWRQLLVPRGFAHGFCTLEENTDVVYKVTNTYAPECDEGICWDDSQIGNRLAHRSVRGDSVGEGQGAAVFRRSSDVFHVPG